MTHSVIKSGRRPEGITMPVEPPPSKRQQIIDAIVAAVRSGELVPGDAIPSTAALMAQHEVSITPVREAVNYLKTRELLVGATGRAVYVANPLPDWI
jgi:GntR family transcriptional regulator